MDEVETRILNIDPKDVETKLLAFGATKVFDGECQSVYFDHQDGRIRAKDQRLRIRKENGTQTLVFKSSLEDGSTHSFLSHVLQIEDIQAAKHLLEGLGFHANLLTTKKRKKFALNNVRFEIDKYTASFENVPIFLEIKASTREEVDNAVKLLGFSKNDCCDWNLDRIEKEYSEG